MQTTLRFFKIGEGPEAGWYADVQGHTLADNQMVAGSDTFLDAIDKMTGSTGEVRLKLADRMEPELPNPMAVLNMRSHNQWGATYMLSGPEAVKHNAVGFELWICNVTHDVFGEHPHAIYIYGLGR